jgi:hypothetical protein
MKNNTAQPSKQVVGYYNLYNLDNKDNRYNEYVEDVPSSTDIENMGEIPVSGLASLPASQNIPASQPGCPQEGQVPQGGILADEDLPILNDDMISRAVIQFFDNGPDAGQQYKLKIRFNLVDKENPEFIATLTKDWSNFKKYIPEECKEFVMEYARELRAKIKAEYDIVPYMGKFHLNTGKQPGQTKTFTNIEPYTLAFVWYDAKNSQWKYFVMLYDFVRNGTFDATYVTKAQTKAGVKTQDLYINPKYDTTKRAKTWAQQRSERR